MRATLLLLTATGCQQLFGLESPQRARSDGGDGSAGSDAIGDSQLDAKPDVLVPSGTCIQKFQQGPVFGPPVLLTAISTASAESDAFVTADGLEIYFQRSNDFYRAIRTSITGAFGQPARVDDLSSTGAETKVFISPNKNRAFFASSRSGGEGGMDLWRGVVGSTSTSWTVDQAYVDIVNDGTDQHDPHMTPDLLHLYYAPIQIQGQKVALSTRGDITQSFGAPSVLTELDGSGAEADPTLTDDELVIVFTSTASGSRRLVYATRGGTSVSFGTVKELTDLNANQGLGDSDAHLSGDGCTLYWTSTRSGNGDIYVATQL